MVEVSVELGMGLSIRFNNSCYVLVSQVQANDQDGVLNVITYEIVSGNEKGNFSIDQHSGAIKTTGPIDRETTEQFILKIRASDSKFHPC